MLDISKPIESLDELAEIEATRPLTDIEKRLKVGFFQLACLEVAGKRFLLFLESVRNRFAEKANG